MSIYLAVSLHRSGVSWSNVIMLPPSTLDYRTYCCMNSSLQSFWGDEYISQLSTHIIIMTSKEYFLNYFSLVSFILGIIIQLQHFFLFYLQILLHDYLCHCPLVPPSHSFYPNLPPFLFWEVRGIGRGCSKHIKSLWS